MPWNHWSVYPECASNGGTRGRVHILVRMDEWRCCYGCSPGLPRYASGMRTRRGAIRDRGLPVRRMASGCRADATFQPAPGLQPGDAQGANKNGKKMGPDGPGVVFEIILRVKAAQLSQCPSTFSPEAAQSIGGRLQRPQQRTATLAFQYYNSTFGVVSKVAETEIYRE